jgi:FMN-dependent NADH-azoreductase
MKILHIDSSSTGNASVSRQLTAALVRELRNQNPAALVVYRDLAADAPSHLGGELLQALRPAPGHAATESVGKELALTDTMLDEFLTADVVVVGAPMYNFSIPSQLKAWLDRLAQPGRTFRYTASGPEGLAGGKRIFVVSSRGGMYAGTAIESLDHQESYLKTIFGFFGVTDVEIVRAEGVSMGPEGRDRALEQALSHAKALAVDYEAAAV